MDVLTVDDSERFRVAARELIAATPGFRAIGEFGSGEDGLRAAKRLHPDLALVDVRMRGMDGIETATRLHAANPRLVILLVSVEEVIDLPHAARTSGAAAFVRKDRLNPRTLAELWARCSGPDAALAG